MKLSLVIPCYEMYGFGASMLKRALKSVATQTFQDTEVIVADNSENDELEAVCSKFYVKYFKNPDRGMAKNTNFAIKKATGELIKILYQDDYFAKVESLETIVHEFTPKVNWLITACSNNPYPFFSKSENTLGSPSVLTIRNQDPLLFNEDLKWVLDLEYYQRMFKRFGLPKILKDLNVVIGTGEHQETNHLSVETKLKEEQQYAKS